jgi:hypothetical protein
MVSPGLPPWDCESGINPVGLDHEPHGRQSRLGEGRFPEHHFERASSRSHGRESRNPEAALAGTLLCRPLLLDLGLNELGQQRQ